MTEQADILTITPPGNGEAVIRIAPDGKLFWHGREVETDSDFRSSMLELASYFKASMSSARPEGREQDAEKWHYCVAYGFPHKDRGGVNWVAYRENGSVVVADTADAAMDRVLRQRRPQEERQ